MVQSGGDCESEDDNENVNPNLVIKSEQELEPFEWEGTFCFDMHSFTRKGAQKSDNQKSMGYKCKCWRSTEKRKIGCPVRLMRTRIPGMVGTQCKKTGEHTCGQQPTEVVAIEEILDVTEEMQKLVQDRLGIDSTITAATLARQYHDTTTLKYKDSRAVIMLTVDDLQSMIYRERTKEFGNWESALNQHPMRSISATDRRRFLHSNCTIGVGEEMERVILWGHPHSIYLLGAGGSHGLTAFIDCTFFVPLGWYSCMILMIYDNMSKDRTDREKDKNRSDLWYQYFVFLSKNTKGHQNTNKQEHSRRGRGLGSPK